MVKYCNAACKKKHRSKHKKACERRASEIYDEQLFKEIEPEECPLCFLPMPIDAGQYAFMLCCGKEICNGCIVAMYMREGGKNLCAFCRTPPESSDEECLKMDKGNGDGFFQLAGHYYDGDFGLPRDHQKANELYLKAGELGCARGYYNLGHSYHEGTGVEADKKKAKYYMELAAIGGSIDAMHNLGCEEFDEGNFDRAYKHFIIAAKAGSKESLVTVRDGFTKGGITKDEYEDTLRAYHERRMEMKSDTRDKAAEEARLARQR